MFAKPPWEVVVVQHDALCREGLSRFLAVEAVWRLPAPNLRGQEEYYRNVVFRMMGIVFLALEATAGLLALAFLS